MALVAYSDESDLSDEEIDATPHTNLVTKVAEEINAVNNSKTTVVIVQSSVSKIKSIQGTIGTPSSGIESIIDEDEVFTIPTSKNILSANSKLVSALADVTKPADTSGSLQAVQEDDLTDVPTKETWKISQDIMKEREEAVKRTGGKSVNGTDNPGSVAKRTTDSKKASISSDLKKKSNKILVSQGKAAQLALGASALGTLVQKFKSSGGKVQFVLEALSEFQVEEEEPIIEEEEEAAAINKKIAPSSAGTGLLSRLPKPKNLVKGKDANRSLVPHILSKPPKKAAPKSNPKTKTVNSDVTTAKSKSSSELLGEYEDSDDEEGSLSKTTPDYFSFDSKDSIRMDHIKSFDGCEIVNEVIETPVTLESTLNINQQNALTNCITTSNQSNTSNIQSNATSNQSITSNIQSIATSHQSNASNIQSNATTNQSNDEEEPMEVVDDHDASNDLQVTNDEDNFIGVKNDGPIEAIMDDASWRRLTGKKRNSEQIEIIEVNGDDALLSREEWMTRAMSQEKPSQSHSKKNGNLPSQQQKRKHQITYLAHQAKEREIELKNDWSSGREKKQKTRAKYGF